MVKIIDPKVEKNKQILNNSYYLSITSGYANNIFTDPTTNYEYELRVIFTKRDEIKLYATPVFDVGKKQHSYFPNNIVFYRLKK